MNKILKLLDEGFVREYFEKKVLPLYPDFKAIKKIKIIAHKRHIWESSYHVVIEYRSVFVDERGVKRQLPIFCSAHSEEPRKNVYYSLKFLWDNGFSSGFLSIPHPLFYDDYFQGTFYRGVAGRNLYQYIREKDFSEIESIVPLAARWFAKLHSVKNAKNFNDINSKIRTVYPGRKHILWRIEKDYPQYLPVYKEAYRIFIEAEEEGFFQINPERWLVHGDAHPENIIRMSRKKIGVIDFTDLCLSDFCRDLGTFLQQMEFMIMRKIKDQAYADRIKKIFLENYFARARRTLDEDTKKRIDNYYHWTAMRTATHFLLKDEPEPDRSGPLIDAVAQKYNISQ